MVTWQRQYALGIDKIDSEHRQLVEMISMLEKAEGRHDEAAIARDIVNRIVVYVGRHFRSEEDAMNSAGYPHLEAHRKSHNDFTRRVYELKASQNPDAAEVRKLLMQWLVDHILKADRDYAPYIQKWLASFSK